MINHLPVCSMTSYPVEIEPRPVRHLAAVAMLLHVAAALLPWATRCPAWLAALLSLIAIAALAATIGSLPGRRGRLRSLAWRGDAWFVRLAGEACERPAVPGPATRVHADLITLDVATAQGRLGWLLTRRAVDPDQFRRLKARLRLAC